MVIGNYFKNINSKFKSHLFTGLSFNSSYCKKNYIFFAIKGTNLDGNKFIDQAIKKGARTIVSDKYHGFKNDVLFIKSLNYRFYDFKTFDEITNIIDYTNSIKDGSSKNIVLK